MRIGFFATTAIWRLDVMEHAHMSAKEMLQLIEPGDICLYSPDSLFGWVIALKTWTKISHCEVYEGAGLSVASRDGVGVNRYAFRDRGICEVRRPALHLDFEAASKWFDGVRGQKYDWAALFRFYLVSGISSKTKMFCSEFATRWYRAAGFEPFSPETDADTVPPSYFTTSAEFHTIWKAT